MGGLIKLAKNIIILGSTGSIGTQALEVARELNIKVSALSANKNIDLLEKQIREFKPLKVAVMDKLSAQKLRDNIKDLSTEVLDGIDGLCELTHIKAADKVLNSLVGMVGLRPTLEAIENGKDIALANKETLVVGGELVIKRAKEKNVKILPVDSEHSAIFQCLGGNYSNKSLKKIILTASGGPFFGKSKEELLNIKKEDALKHPNWSMGAKITIDSATMMNKGFEIIEAMWLFGVKIEDIDVLVHRESIVHSLIEYCDNSVIAQLGLPSMKIPIQYSLTYPERYNSSVKELDLSKLMSLSFYNPDYDTFECINICKKAVQIGGTLPAAINGANEEAVKLFLNDKISFLDIQNVLNKVLDKYEKNNLSNVEDILRADSWARNFVNAYFKEEKGW